VTVEMKQNAIETVLVEAFVAHLGAVYGYVGLHLEEVPDETTAGEIDGIAGPFAIEHTSIDSYPDQRTRGSFFERVVAPLELEIRPNRRVAITVPQDHVARGMDFAEITAAFRQWISSECAKLAEGSHVVESALGLPLRFSVEISGSRPPGLVLG
jgi:hypothetical protein